MMGNEPPGSVPAVEPRRRLRGGVHWRLVNNAKLRDCSLRCSSDRVKNIRTLNIRQEVS